MSRHTTIAIALLLLPGAATARGQSVTFNASQDIPVANGGILNDYTYTHVSDNQCEGITELRTGGAPYQKETYLIHKWAIPVSAQYDSWAFHVEAHHTLTEGYGYDDFNFAWSPDDVSYYHMLTVTKISDDDNEQVCRFYPPPTDTIYIRVTDTVPNGFQGRDTIYVDHMYVENYHDNIFPVISNVAHTLSDHAWVRLAPVVEQGPLRARERFAMAYHQGVGKVILFGGATDSGLANDTWIYDYATNTWSNAQPQADLPAPRFDHAMAYRPDPSDPSLDRVFLFGGRARLGEYAEPVDGMWEYDYGANTWTEVNYFVVGGVIGPREGMQMVYDADIDALIMFGGYADGVGRVGDTWAYDPTAGLAGTWNNLSPPVAPTPRDYYAMAYAGAGKTVLFGGSTATDSRNDETWVYNSDPLDPPANTWANVSPIEQDTPVGRIWATMAYDGSLGQVMLFGGNDGNCQLNDTWAYNVGSNDWYQLDPDQLGGELRVREAPSIVYDEMAGRPILFGGWTTGDGCGAGWAASLNDTWEYVNGDLVAEVSWHTDELSDSTVCYGTNPEVLDSIASDPAFVMDHVVVLRELEPGRPYYYQVQSTDVGNNTTVDDNCYVFPDTSPPEISNVGVADVTPWAATITWTTDEASDSVVNYGLSHGLGLSASNAAMVTSHSVPLDELSPETTYYYEVRSTDASDNAATDNNSGQYYSFTTEAAPPENAMHVAAIDMWYTTQGSKYRVYTRVTVVDALEVGVEGATVNIETMLPDSATVNDSGSTGADGSVTLQYGLTRVEGTYMSTVTAVAKEGWTYDYSENEETSESLNVP